MNTVLTYRQLEAMALERAYDVLLHSLSCPTKPTALGVYGVGEGGAIAGLLLIQALQIHCRSSSRGMLKWSPHNFSITGTLKSAQVIVSLHPLSQSEFEALHRLTATLNHDFPPVYAPLIKNVPENGSYEFPWQTNPLSDTLEHIL